MPCRIATIHGSSMSEQVLAVTFWKGPRAVGGCKKSLDNDNDEIVPCIVQFNQADQLIEIFTTGEPIDEVKSPLRLVIGNHVAGISYQDLGKIPHLFGISCYLASNVPQGSLSACVIAVGTPVQRGEKALCQRPRNDDIQLSIVYHDPRKNK